MAILFYPVEYNDNINLYYVRYNLKYSFTVNVYLSIMYGLFDQRNYINYNSVIVCLNVDMLLYNMNYEYL